MPKINVYVTDTLDQAIKATGIKVSPVCQEALEAEVLRNRARQVVMAAAPLDDANLEKVVCRLRESKQATEVNDYRSGFELGIKWAREKASHRELSRLAPRVARSEWGAVDVSDENYTLPAFLLVSLGKDDDLDPTDFEDLVDDKPFDKGVADGLLSVWRAVESLI